MIWEFATIRRYRRTEHTASAEIRKRLLAAISPWREWGTATDESEHAAKAAADAAGTILNQHQSYYHVDAETDDRRHGRHPLLHREDLGVLGNNCLLSHMNVIRDDEVEPVVRSRLSIA